MRGPRRAVAAAVLVALAGCGAPVDAAPVATAPADAAAIGAAPVDVNAYRAAVVDTWSRYLGAVRGRDGAAAASTVTTGTLARYESLRQAALTADATGLDALALTDEMTVMVWRAVVPPSVVRSAAARELLARSVEAGLNGDGTSGALTDVFCDGRRAIGTYVRGSDGATASATFVLEDGAWRLDLLPMVSSMEEATVQAWQASGLSRRDFVARSLGTVLTARQIAAAALPLDGSLDPLAQEIQT
jgi:hypothetical protein